MKKSISLFLFFFSFFIICGMHLQADNDQTNLEAQIYIKSEGGRIQPGTPVTLCASVKNLGKQPSAQGTIQLQFAYPKPIDTQAKSLIFETEKAELPSIEPGKDLVITFKTPHQLPSLFDFIRNDWGMRQYHALITIGDKVQLAGTRGITFSAYYYEGPSHEIPVEVLAK